MHFSVNTLFWDSNDADGFRSVHFSMNSNVLMAFCAHRHNGTWSSKMVPMGFSVQCQESTAYCAVLQYVPDLLQKLQCEVLSSTEIMKYVLELQEKVDTIIRA